MKKPTIATVAEQAGVAVSTVSRYLNGHYVSAPVQARLSEVIAALGYSRSWTARNLSLGRRGCIGVAVDSSSDPWFVQLLMGIEEELSARDTGLMLSSLELRGQYRSGPRLLLDPRPPRGRSRPGQVPAPRARTAEGRRRSPVADGDHRAGRNLSRRPGRALQQRRRRHRGGRAPRGPRTHPGRIRRRAGAFDRLETPPARTARRARAPRDSDRPRAHLHVRQLHERGRWRVRHPVLRVRPRSRPPWCSPTMPWPSASCASPSSAGSGCRATFP